MVRDHQITVQGPCPRSVQHHISMDRDAVQLHLHPTLSLDQSYVPLKVPAHLSEHSPLPGDIELCIQRAIDLDLPCTSINVQRSAPVGPADADHRSHGYDHILVHPRHTCTTRTTKSEAPAGGIVPCACTSRPVFGLRHDHGRPCDEREGQ